MKKIKLIRTVFFLAQEKAIVGLTEVPAKNLLEPIIENRVASLYRVIQGK